LQGALKGAEEKGFSSRKGIFDTFRKLHPKLKDGFYLRPEEDEEDPYESSQMMVVIANAHGIFGVYPMREIYQFSRFWAIGSGRKFAMGAMFAAYEQNLSARNRRNRRRAGCEFDVNSCLPMTVYTVEVADNTARKETA
jgi:ATP-dependent protease HslVU (ClpYQ) peptidase subunit